MSARLEHGVQPRAGRELVPTIARWAAMGPTDLEIGPSDFRLAGEFTRIADLAPDGPVVCCINGEWISRRDWWQPVRSGDVIVFRDVSAIGDGDNSDVLRTVLTIVVLVVAQQYGAAVGAAAGFSGTTATAVGTALITVAGNLIVNAILPGPSQAGGFSNQAATSPTYSLGGSGNTARLGQSIPVRYGQEFVYPDFACQPYAEYDANDDQFYCAVLCVGYGHYNILQVTIEDTDIRSFDDVQVVLVGPGQAERATIFPGVETLAEQSIVADNIVVAPEVSQTDLANTEWIGGFACVAAGRQMEAVSFDVVYPEGLGAVQPDGSVASYGVTLQFSVRAINDFGQPIGAWQLLGSVTQTGASRQPVRRSYSYAVAAGRYQARVRRVLDVSASAYVFDSAVWVGLRAQLTVPGVQRDDCTYVVVRMRANEQLSGLSQRRIGVHAQRLIPIYDVDTQTWGAPTFTRNPAHAFADILHDDIEGRGLADSRIDHVTLADLAVVYAARQDHFDFSFDTRRTVDEALQLVARAGRARPILRRGAVYTMVRDEQQAAPVAMFMPRNMQADSFSMSFRLNTEETPDCVRMEFRNGATWQTDYVYAQIHLGGIVFYGTGSSGVPLRPVGVPEPQRVQDEKLSGVTGRTHALRETIFLVADSLFRPISCEWKAELDGLLPTIGSLVGTAHDVAAWGQSGDVANWDVGTLTLETTEPLMWAPGQTHYVRLQTSVGGASAAIAVTPGPDDQSMVLASEPDEAPVFAAADRERTRYLFGSLADVTRYTRIKRIGFESQTDVMLSAVLEDNRAHTADVPLLPAPGQVQDPLTTGSFSGGDAGAGGDSEGGSGIPVVLADNTAISNGPVLYLVAFNNDATIDSLRVYGSPGLGVTQWLATAPVGPGIAGEFEIRFSLIAVDLGAPAIIDGPLDTWLSLATSRSLGFYGTTGYAYDPAVPPLIGSVESRAVARVRVEIRDAATELVQATAVWTLAEIIPTGGG